MSLTYGAMFAGYGGLDMGVQSVLGGRMAWCAEVEKAPSRILARHWPDAPNLGDVTKVDWHAVPKVDVITGGSPCQDLSHAGKRKGMHDGTRSNLWAEMREAVAAIRPRLVVWENVRGALSAGAASDLGQCPRCVGDPRDAGPVLRALGRVLGDLADLGYDARWYGLRAADVGAAHGRFRIFLFATPARDAEGLGVEGLRAKGVEIAATQAGPGLLGRAGDRVVGPPVTLLPTPAVNDMGASYTPEEWDAWTERMRAAHGNGNGHGKSLSIEAQRLLPTPRAIDASGIKTSDRARYLDSSKDSFGDIIAKQDWREYDTAIRRHEAALGRPAPPPIEPGAKGQPRLSPRFVEWLMMLPDGHVTDVPGVSRNEQLKVLGNGVVPAQAAAATRWWAAQTVARRTEVPA